MPNRALAITLQSDGKILAVGGVGSLPVQIFVLRYNPNGTLDTTFDDDGVVIKPVGITGEADSVAVQSDGKIVIGGYTFNNLAQDFFTFVRFNQDGSTDTSFGNSGVTLADFGIIDFFGEVIIQPDGKILGIGSGDVSSNNPLLAMVRLNSNGSFDTSFDGDGRVTRQLPALLDETSSIDLQKDGKIVVGGSNNENITAYRYNSNGSLDTTFGTNGLATTDLNNLSYGSDIKVQTNGKIVVGGRVSTGNGATRDDFALVRLNSNGGLDSGFGNSGKVITPITAEEDQLANLAIQSDGKIMVVGCAGPGSNKKAAIVRYLGDNISPNRVKFDFDGDGKSDISVFRPNGSNPSNWYVLNSSNNSFAVNQFGIETDKITPSDYDGDGKADISVYRNGIWYILNSSNSTVRVESFGLANDKTVPADYDGDRKADLAVYREGIWYVLGSTQGFYSLQFGINTDKPVPADYDGDGKTDQAIYRNGEWHLLRSNLGYTVIQFGNATDKPVASDYDGDGKADQAVFRDGVWHVLGSTQGYNAVQFGITTDIPVPADFDGDGKTDRAVYRDGIWHILGSNSGYNATQFGVTTDTPIPTSNNPQ
jgi:uncharacterized delta-60 repeat protein